MTRATLARGTTLFDPPRQPRAQVGIETMIVFVAMILVAAVGATMLISTAGSLQSAAETTSEDSEAQVSDQLLVVGATGTVDASDGDRAVDGINLTVMVSPGADEIDLSAATIELVGPTTHRTFAYADAAESGAFTVRPFVDRDGSGPVLTERSDRFGVRLALEDEALRLGPGERATVRIVGASGSVRTTIVGVPPSLRSYDDGDAVAL